MDTPDSSETYPYQKLDLVRLVVKGPHERLKNPYSLLLNLCTTHSGADRPQISAFASLT